MSWEIAEVNPSHEHIRCAKYADLLDYHHGVGGEGPHAFTWSDKPHRLVYDLTAMATEYRDEITRLRAKVEGLRNALTPFAEFALVRSAAGSTSPKTGQVYSVHTRLGEAEITAEDFEAAFNAIGASE